MLRNIYATNLKMTEFYNWYIFECLRKPDEKLLMWIAVNGGIEMRRCKTDNKFISNILTPVVCFDWMYRYPNETQIPYTKIFNY